MSEDTNTQPNSNVNTLLEMFRVNEPFSQLSTERKEIFARLADAFDDNPLALYLTPAELASKLSVGNAKLWQEFLQLEPVKQYIRGQMSFNAQVAARKSLPALAQNAHSGDSSAVKQLNEMAGLYGGAADNKIVVLHRINRPKKTRRPPTPPTPTEGEAQPQ